LEIYNPRFFALIDEIKKFTNFILIRKNADHLTDSL